MTVINRSDIKARCGITDETEYALVTSEEVDGGINVLFTVDMVVLEYILSLIPDSTKDVFPYVIKMDVPEGGGSPSGVTVLHHCRDFKMVLESYESYRLAMSTVDQM